MSEATAAEAAPKAAAKSKTEYTPVTMTDGRVVQFAGKRRLNKEYLIDETKFEVDEAAGIIQIGKGGIKVRLDFLNGETRTLDMPLTLIPQFAGHGGVQKAGDNLASSAAEPLSDDDMVIATDELFAEFAKGSWGKGRAEGGGGVSGASDIIRAIMEVNNVGRPDNGKPVLDVAAVKAHIENLVAKEATKPEGERLTKRDFYKAFRADAKIGARIKEIEDARALKNGKVVAADALATL